MVIASENATFGLLEGKRGLAALAGALPRVIRNFGLQRAMDLGLTARILPVREAQQWGLVKDVVPPDQLIGRAVAVALEIVELSPESVIVTRAGIREGWESGSLNRATAATAERFRHRLFTGENMREGKNPKVVGHGSLTVAQGLQHFRTRGSQSGDLHACDVSPSMTWEFCHYLDSSIGIAHPNVTLRMSKKAAWTDQSFDLPANTSAEVSNSSAPVTISSTISLAG